MKTLRDSILDNVPNIPFDEPNRLADACLQALIALEIDSPMSIGEQLRAIHLYQELLNDQ